jgi:hypothetical protein
MGGVAHQRDASPHPGLAIEELFAPEVRSRVKV